LRGGDYCFIGHYWWAIKILGDSGPVARTHAEGVDYAHEYVGIDRNFNFMAIIRQNINSSHGKVVKIVTLDVLKGWQNFRRSGSDGLGPCRRRGLYTTINSAKTEQG